MFVIQYFVIRHVRSHRMSDEEERTKIVLPFIAILIFIIFLFRTFCAYNNNLLGFYYSFAFSVNSMCVNVRSTNNDSIIVFPFRRRREEKRIKPTKKHKQKLKRKKNWSYVPGQVYQLSLVFVCFHCSSHLNTLILEC